MIGDGESLIGFLSGDVSEDDKASFALQAISLDDNVYEAEYSELVGLASEAGSIYTAFKEAEANLNPFLATYEPQYQEYLEA